MRCRPLQFGGRCLRYVCLVCGLGVTRSLCFKREANRLACWSSGSSLYEIIDTPPASALLAQQGRARPSFASPLQPQMQAVTA